MTKAELLAYLEKRAKDYRKNCVDSINRNSHMNEIRKEEETTTQPQTKVLKKRPGRKKRDDS